MTDLTLKPRQAKLLREAADNGGRIYLGEWDTDGDVKTADQLTRLGVFSAGDPAGHGWRHITEHGREWLAANTKENQ